MRATHLRENRALDHDGVEIYSIEKLPRLLETARHAPEALRLASSPSRGMIGQQVWECPGFYVRDSLHHNRRA